ncbi:uncharacterized protein LOC134196559 [Corticium candelabrum]|uniref:uncharacterized protein LOC134196559 n=1 Tax=Corticium candelabrum TaxID=121492 RepID=UPI002E2599EE|nr:uncharacterized protein LOC134196559 [Corticium candelabrum]
MIAVTMILAVMTPILVVVVQAPATVAATATPTPTPTPDPIAHALAADLAADLAASLVADLAASLVASLVADLAAGMEDRVTAMAAVRQMADVATAVGDPAAVTAVDTSTNTEVVMAVALRDQTLTKEMKAKESKGHIGNSLLTVSLIDFV